MIESLNAKLPQEQAVGLMFRPLGKMSTVYMVAIAFVVCLQLWSNLLEVSQQEFNVAPAYIVGFAIVAVLVPVLLAIPAGLITAIGAIWVKKGRSRVFMRSHFYLMVLLIPMSVIAQLAKVYLR
jgi:hypothetical protein